MKSSITCSSLEENIFHLKEATDTMLRDTIGLGQKMQEAFERHTDSYLSQQVLWKALQAKN